MKINLRFPHDLRKEIPDLPYQIEGAVAPRAGEYLAIAIPDGADDPYQAEMYFQIVRVAYIYDDNARMEVALALRRVEGSSLDDIAD
jgi:hypothetical protein